MAQDRLEIKNFAQIENLSLELGDLTVLVGAQATGKSMALQWLKAAIDGAHLVKSLRDAGHATKNGNELIDLIFGAGMKSAWTKHTEIKFRGRKISLPGLSRLGKSEENVFFIPAQRSMLISDGWAQPFQRLNADTPVVARIFSQTLFDRFNNSGGETLFPIRKRLKNQYREQIKDSIFHGGVITIEEISLRKHLKLKYDGASLPFMTWTAGQREFAPLLFGLYHLLPSTGKGRTGNVEWAVIEEPEMGLHPRAQTVFLLLVLELLSRGYRVVLSTHSPHILTAVWMLQRLKENGAGWKLVCEGFGMKASGMRKVAEAALKKSYKVHYLKFGSNGKVTSQDISGLDPGAESEGESGWGGLTEFSSCFESVVAKSVNQVKV